MSYSKTCTIFFSKTTLKKINQDDKCPLFLWFCFLIAALIVHIFQKFATFPEEIFQISLGDIFSFMNSILPYIPLYLPECLILAAQISTYSCTNWTETIKSLASDCAGFSHIFSQEQDSGE